MKFSRTKSPSLCSARKKSEFCKIWTSISPQIATIAPHSATVGVLGISLVFDVCVSRNHELCDICCLRTEGERILQNLPPPPTHMAVPPPPPPPQDSLFRMAFWEGAHALGGKATMVGTILTKEMNEHLTKEMLFPSRPFCEAPARSARRQIVMRYGPVAAPGSDACGTMPMLSAFPQPFVGLTKTAATLEATSLVPWQLLRPGMEVSFTPFPGACLGCLSAVGSWVDGLLGGT